MIEVVTLLIWLQDITGNMSFISGTHLDGCRELLIQREANSFKTSYASDLVLSVVIQTVSRSLRRGLD